MSSLRREQRLSAPAIRFRSGVQRGAHEVVRRPTRTMAQEDDRRIRAVQGHRRHQGRQERAMGSREAGFAAECEYAMVDADLRNRSLRERAPSLRWQLGGRHQEVSGRRRRRQKAQAQLQPSSTPMRRRKGAAAISRQGALRLMRTAFTTPRSQLSSSTPRPRRSEAVRKQPHPDDQDKADQLRQK